MTHRRAPRRIAARLNWERFVSRNQPIIVATGLPESIFSSIDHFDDFLRSGHLDHPADSQYGALVTLTESYFAAGYEWFTPSVLRPIDQEALGKRFADGRPLI